MTDTDQVTRDWLDEFLEACRKRDSAKWRDTLHSLVRKLGRPTTEPMAIACTRFYILPRRRKLARACRWWMYESGADIELLKYVLTKIDEVGP